MRIKDSLMNEFFDAIEQGKAQENKPIEQDSKDDITVLKEDAEKGDINAQIKLGRYYHHKNNHKLALVYYGLAAESNDKEAIRQMADLYIKSRNFDKAIQCYNKLESIDGKPRNLEIGKVLLNKGEKSRALEYIKKSAKCGNKDAVRILETLDYKPDIQLLEEKAQLRKDMDSALALAEYYYGTDSQLSAFWYHFAYTHNYVYPLVKEQIKSIFGTSLYSEDGLERGEEKGNAGQFFNIKNKTGRLRREIDEMEKAFTADKDFSLMIEIGDKYESLGEHTQALQKYFMAIDEGLKDAYVKVAEVFMRTGDFYNGMYWLQKSTRYNDVSAYRYLARIYKEMNDKENLMVCYIKLQELGDMSVYIDLARLYEERMELSDAISCYKKYMEWINSKPECLDFSFAGFKVQDINNRILTLDKLLSLTPEPVERLEKIFNTYKKHASLAAIKLGTIFYEGNGVKKDYCTSAYWYRQASEK